MGSIAATRLSITRRNLFKGFGLGSLVAVCRPTVALAATFSAPAAVVGFHNDAPWLDLSGRDLPYIPPSGGGTRAPDDESLTRLGFFL